MGTVQSKWQCIWDGVIKKYANSEKRFLEGNVNMLMELYRKQHIPHKDIAVAKNSFLPILNYFFI